MKVFNRPMFRKGGSTAQGSGIGSLQPRKMYADSNYQDLLEQIKSGQQKYVQSIRASAEPTTAEKIILLGRIASTPGNLYEKSKAALPAISKILEGKKQAEEKANLAELGGMTDIAKLQIAARDKSGMTPSKVKEFNFLLQNQVSAEERRLGRKLSDAERDAIVKDVTSTLFPTERKTLSPEAEFRSLLKTEVGLDIQSKLKNLKAASVTKDRESYLRNLKALETMFDFYKSAYPGVDPYKMFTIPNYNPNEDRKMKADGGRIGYADGTPDNSVIPVQEQALSMGQQESPPVQTQELKSFSFQELRTKLPPEVTDDIVRLLSNSQDALRDFAYITTQQDINKFNQKYGVNLVLPIQQG